ncbi:hypothetical protein M514_23036 [Trichuris suis]|uniref:Secreted protein n=1 Tax=Trichuris suis TaxID=68888 RepID=A0A085N5S8_9BILA|nr:hypothetical protein M514_23036 [Trichuris suis]
MFYHCFPALCSLFRPSEAPLLLRCLVHLFLQDVSLLYAPLNHPTATDIITDSDSCLMSACRESCSTVLIPAKEFNEGGLLASSRKDVSLDV